MNATTAKPKRKYYNFAVLVELMEWENCDQRRRRRVWRGYRAYSDCEAADKAEKPLDVWRVVRVHDRKLTDDEFCNLITNTRPERALQDRRK